MVTQAGCELVGVATVVEKIFESGREKLEQKYGVRVESLAPITYLDEDKIVFDDDPQGVEI